MPQVPAGRDELFARKGAYSAGRLSALGFIGRGVGSWVVLSRYVGGGVLFVRTLCMADAAYELFPGLVTLYVAEVFRDTVKGKITHIREYTTLGCVWVFIVDIFITVKGMVGGHVQEVFSAVESWVSAVLDGDSPDFSFAEFAYGVSFLCPDLGLEAAFLVIIWL